MNRRAAMVAGPPRRTMTDQTARFETVYRKNLPDVYRYATARLGTSDGEEVTAEVFHAAAVAFNDAREEHVTPAWLMAVTRNKVIDRWRKAERRNALAHLLQPGKGDLVTFPDDWAADPNREAVLAALDKVSDRHRALLILHYVDGMPAREIAETLGMSVSSIESALARARGSFRRYYGEGG